MNPNTKVTVWLKDGSVLKDWVLVSTDLKLSGSPLDIRVLDKVDDAFVYISGGTKMYRDRVGGTINVLGAGLGGALALSLDQINVLNASDGAPDPAGRS